jgi:uncharacterized protein
MALPAPSSGSTAVITGASSGIGEELARQLAARGHGVFLVARREDRLRKLAAALERDHGIRAEVAAADLADPEQADAIPGLVEERGLVASVLVNNAGFSTVGDVHLNPDRQLGMVHVNIEALVALTAAVLPGMTQRHEGAVINVASMAAFQPVPSQAVYAATKSFVLSFSEAVATELRGTGVTMTAVCPGPVETEFMEAAEFKKPKEELGPQFLWATAADVARAAIEGAEAGKRVVVPGTTNRAIALTVQHIPNSILLRTFAPLYRRTIGE